MHKMRLAGLIVFTLFTLLMLGVSLAGAVHTPHSRDDLPVADMLAGLVLALAMTAAAGGLWFRWLLRRRTNGSASRSPLPGVPRSKYAVWANTPRRRAAKPMSQSPMPTHKPRRRRG